MKILLKSFINWFLIIFLTFAPTNSLVFAQNIDQFALPTGGQVVSGNIDINQPSVGRLDVNQTTQQGIVNWNTFNVGSSASVYFNQPTNKSTILNNVVTGKSIINGSIFSNGRLILVNPTGILMGPTSAVRAEGAILSTLNITNQNFLNNNLSFSTDKLSQLTASGKIDAQYVALISPEINNKGQIIAKASTALAAGDDVLLSISGSNKLTVKVKPSKLKSLAKNEGTIETKNGIVTIKADAAQSLVDETIKITDSKAQGLVSENGVIKLVSNTGSIEASEIKIDAGSKGEANISGKLDVNSLSGKGGDVEITGKELNLVSAKLSADGKEGGGKILIGGDWQGKGDLLQSTYTSIDKNSVLSASATESGAGGTIVAWSNIKDTNSVTSVYGTLTAKGIDGDGGQIETSGAILNYNGIKVNTSSLIGNYGNWLLDPTNITIGSSEASTIVSNLGTSDVTQTATNTITVNNNIAYTGARNANLTFDATTTVLNANISSNNGTLSVDINTILEIGASNTSITTNGGNVDISGVIRAVTGETNNFTIDAGSGNVTFSSNVTKAVGDYSAGFTQGSFTNVSDLDFSGTFLNAINIAGNAVTVGDVAFQRGHAGYNTSNSNESFQNQIASWNATAWSNSGLTELMRGIRWSWGNQQSPYVQFTNATAGKKYKIQALFKERCCNRYFDVYVDGTKIVDDFKPALSGGPSTGRYLTYQFEASSSNVMFRMSGRSSENGGPRLHGNDVNPILNAISVEEVDAGAALNNLSITANQFSAQAIEVGGDLTVTNSGNSTISGVISGDTALIKAGSGQLTTSANNTYTGGTTVSAGTLFGGAASRSNDVFGTGSISVASGATLWVDRTDDGALTNALTLNGGTLRGTNGFGQYWDGNITLGAHSTIKAANNFYIDGVISGSSKNLIKTGNGTVILRGTNTYSGTTTVSAGTLNIGGSGSLGSGTYAGNISNSGTFTYASSTAQTLSGVISGSGAVVSSGSGAITLSGTNTYTGTTTITGGGNLVGGNIAAFGGVLSPTIISNSTSDQFSLANGISLAGLTIQGPVRLNSGITTIENQTYTGDVVVGAGSKASPVEFASLLGDIQFLGTLKGQGNAKNRSMTAVANGNVTYGDRVGYAFNLETVDPTNTADSFYKMTTTANTITLKGDVMTYEEQVYNGDVLIGSTGSNGTTRTVLSMDPKVIFNGKVNDTVKGKHSLIAKAVEIDRGINTIPTVQFKSTVGSIKALKSYTGLTGFQVSGARWGTINPSSAFGTRIGVGQKMTGGVVNSAAKEKAKMAAKTAARASKFKPINEFGPGPLNFRPFGGGNSFRLAKSVEIVYSDNPKFGDIKARPAGNNFDIGKPLAKGSVEGNNPSGQGFFGRLFGSPKGNPTDFKPANMETAKDFNAPPKQFKDIKDLFKTFEGKPQKGEFFNPYKLGSKPKQRVENKPQAQNNKSLNNTNSNPDAIIEDEENN